MDILTLAMAKAYTDEKVGGGGSGGGLPVVEITTMPSADGSILTEEEAALLNEAEATGAPFIVKVSSAYAELMLVMSRVAQPSENTVVHFCAAHSGLAYMLIHMGEMWLFMNQTNSESGGGFPDWELTTEFVPGEDTALNDDDIEFFAGLEGALCTVRFGSGSWYHKCVPSVSTSGMYGAVRYEFSCSQYDLAIFENDTGWWCHIDLHEAGAI